MTDCTAKTDQDQTAFDPEVADVLVDAFASAAPGLLSSVARSLGISRRPVAVPVLQLPGSGRHVAQIGESAGGGAPEMGIGAAGGGGGSPGVRSAGGPGYRPAWAGDGRMAA